MSTPRTIRVAALQPELHELQPMPNMHLLRQMTEQVVREQAPQLVVLPEAFNGQPCEYDEGMAAVPSRRFLATLARACGVSVVGGSIEIQDEDGRRRNTCFVVDREGREVGRYDKRVLFGREPDTRTPGVGAGVFEVAGLRVGVLICGDLWDPSLAREMFGRIDLLCVPAKTSVPSERQVEYAREVWWNLALTRAMENAVPVVVSDWAAARHDTKRLIDGDVYRDTRFTAGGASISDPGKRPDFPAMQRRRLRGTAGTLTAEIDLEAVAKYRAHRQAVGLLPK